MITIFTYGSNSSMKKKWIIALAINVLLLVFSGGATASSDSNIINNIGNSFNSFWQLIRGNVQGPKINTAREYRLVDIFQDMQNKTFAIDRIKTSYADHNLLKQVSSELESININPNLYPPLCKENKDKFRKLRVYSQALNDALRLPYEIYSGGKLVFSTRNPDTVSITPEEKLQINFKLLRSLLLPSLGWKNIKALDEQQINEMIHLAIASRTQTFDSYMLYLILEEIKEEFQGCDVYLSNTIPTRKEETPSLVLDAKGGLHAFYYNKKEQKVFENHLSSKQKETLLKRLGAFITHQSLHTSLSSSSLSSSSFSSRPTSSSEYANSTSGFFFSNVGQVHFKMLMCDVISSNGGSVEYSNWQIAIQTPEHYAIYEVDGENIIAKNYNQFKLSFIDTDNGIKQDVGEVIAERKMVFAVKSGTISPEVITLNKRP